jgi:septum formation protein
MNNFKVLLASTSPRRRQMLAWVVDEFNAVSANIDETPFAEEEPGDYVRRMARLKGEQALQDYPEVQLLLASDTIVVHGGKILGKPKDAADAQRMLVDLRGKIHTVLTAITIINQVSGLTIHDCCIAEVPMRLYTDEEIRQYIASGDPFDKAGAYAIQNESFHPVEKFSGCYACVMGLPLCHVVRQLSKMGMSLSQDIMVICYQRLSYSCTVSNSVLSFKDQITCCN